MPKFLFLIIFCIFINISAYSSEKIEEIKIIGNDRISKETIEMFGNIKINDTIDDNKINQLLKNIYETNFFYNVSISFINKILTISVEENPIIQNININGIKSKSLKESLFENISLKSKSSFNKSYLTNDIFTIENILKERGYYFSKIDTAITNLDKNRIDLNINIDLGKKAKINKITFVGDKIYKDNKLRSVIISEEYKFWKFISGKKYLNETLIKLDNRLLKNFYLNKGYYNAKINSSFAKLVNNNEFELIFNIIPNQKTFFNNVNLEIPYDFDENNFKTLKNYFKEINGKTYSINVIEDIISKIENIALLDQYESVDVEVEEKLLNNQLDIIFKITNKDKFYVNRINIFGNNITNENVIRNRLYLDEGDPFNQILFNKSINEIKSLNFFKEVGSEIIDDKENQTKSINIFVDEKPTGEISLGAGFGTGGASIAFAVKENNFLGKGLSIDTSLYLGEDTITGKFEVINPKYNDTDKLVFYNVESTEVDKLSTYGYKSNKTGFSFGTNFEYYDNLYLGLGFENFIEKIETSASASASQRSQAGNYWDTFLNLDFNYDKRNQSFETTSGYYSLFKTKLPLVSESLTLTNEYNYKYFTELYENNITTAAFSLSFANSLNNNNIKLSERLFVPSRKIRGFESGKIGPKDGNDFIGGNMISTFNIVSNLPKVFENSQNLDFSIFFDAANISGVDYNSSLDRNNKIVSAIGIGFDWTTPVGPLSFSIAQPITKNSTDITESFRFNLGTSF